MKNTIGINNVKNFSLKVSTNTLAKLVTSNFRLLNIRFLLNLVDPFTKERVNNGYFCSNNRIPIYLAFIQSINKHKALF